MFLSNFASIAGEHDTLAIKPGRFVLADLQVEPRQETGRLFEGPGAILSV
jgi:hypothetical protein